ncbi:MAG: heme exporter protein CcmD [Hyphomonadaceae bacterium]
MSIVSSPQWIYIWPAYALAVLVFAGLFSWAFLKLHAAARRARALEKQ